MINPASIAVQGVGYGPLNVILQGFLVVDEDKPTQIGNGGGSGYTFTNIYKVKRRKDGEFALLTLL